MGYLIGTDEAGYGPNLGPLVVAATVWQVDDRRLREDLYDILASGVTRQLDDQTDRVAIADSKLLYRPTGTLRALERGVLGGLAALDMLPSGWRMLWNQLCPGIDTELDRIPWYRKYDCPLPVSAELHDLHLAGTRLSETCQQQDTRLQSIHARTIFPARFNRLVQRHESKGVVLSHVTLDLVSEIVSQLPGEPMVVVCDKHGGRNRYAVLLQPRFCDQLVRVHRESRQESSYRVDLPGKRIELYFRVGGESFLPSAFASMTAKYLRELAMKAFNAFWQSCVADLRPTAGYPGDSRRFRQAIRLQQTQLGVRDGVLWRCR